MSRRGRLGRARGASRLRAGVAEAPHNLALLQTGTPVARLGSPPPAAECEIIRSTAGVTGLPTQNRLGPLLRSSTRRRGVTSTWFPFRFGRGVELVASRQARLIRSLRELKSHPAPCRAPDLLELELARPEFVEHETELIDLGLLVVDALGKLFGREIGPMVQQERPTLASIRYLPSIRRPSGLEPVSPVIGPRVSYAAAALRRYQA